MGDTKDGLQPSQFFETWVYHRSSFYWVTDLKQNKGNYFFLQDSLWQSVASADAVSQRDCTNSWKKSPSRAVKVWYKSIIQSSVLGSALETERWKQTGKAEVCVDR